MKRLIVLFLLTALSIGCASGTNPYMNNANMGGLIGGTGGAVGGAILGKNLKGGAKIAAIGGGAILGMLLGNKVGSWFDEKDKKRNHDLIQKVLEQNQDNETGSIQYSKSWKNPNGQTQTGMVTQSITPRRTYQQHLGADGKRLVPGGYNDSLYAQNDIGRGPYGHGARPLNNDYSYGGDFYNGVLKGNRGGNRNGQRVANCREFEMTVSVDGKFLGTAEDQSTTYYQGCRFENGWRYGR